jgi:hypothetical protein
MYNFANDMDDKNAIQTTMSALINDVRGIVESGLKKAYQNVNAITVFTYWQVGKRIVEEEQQGEKRAEYGRCSPNSRNVSSPCQTIR